MFTATLITKHHKLPTIAPTSRRSDGASTPSRSTPTSWAPSPVTCHASKQKALLGATRSDAEWLLASEGSISHWFGGVHRDTELVVAVHQASGTTVAGRVSELGITCVRFTVDQLTTSAQIVAECAAADLPRHRALRSHGRPQTDHRSRRTSPLTANRVQTSCRDTVRHRPTRHPRRGLRDGHQPTAGWEIEWQAGSTSPPSVHLVHEYFDFIGVSSQPQGRLRRWSGNRPS